MRVVAVLPAKGQSERIANKNLAILDGEYLFKRKLRQLLACEFITEVYLDTDSDEIAAHALDLDVRRLERPAALASNSADGHAIFAWAMAQVGPADLYIQALCTAPFVTDETLARAFGALKAAPEADSLCAVRPLKQYVWADGVPSYERDGRIPNSVDLPWTLVEAMSLYMVRGGATAPPMRRIGASPLAFPLTALEDIDINTPEDLHFAEQVSAGLRAQANAEFNILRPHLSTPLLADIVKERGRNGVLPERIRLTTTGRLLGRAKTLSLGPLAESGGPDDWHGIYRALDSYAFVRPGDVIVVETAVPGRAYFGELNANLAVRSGAVGAVIDGFTRDTPYVRALGFPTFAHGSHSNDIKYEGTLKSMNAPVQIGEVQIHNNDVIFGDEDGVVVIAAADWPEVRALAIDSLAREAAIKLQVLRGVSVRDILEGQGAF